MKIDNIEPMIVPIGCKSDCRGEGFPCVDLIRNVVADGNIAFMLFSEHVYGHIKLDYKVEVKHQNGIPIGMYISEKGSLSVYSRFN